MSADETLDELRKQRQATWDILRRKEPDLVRILEMWDALLARAEGQRPTDGVAATPTVTVGPYSHFDAAADALDHYIRQHGPTKRLEAMRAVVEGGWANDRQDAMGIMRDAVNYQLKRAASPRIVLRKGDILDLA